MATIVKRATKGSPLTTTELDSNFENLNSDKLENITGESIEDLSDVASMTPTDGQLLTWDSATSKWNAEDAPVSLPDQTGHSGKYLTTNGSSASWGTVDLSSKQDILSEGAFVDGDKTKLDGIESGADVTDTANVTSAGALMDSEVTNLAQVKAFDSSDYATAAQGALADSALQANQSITLSGDVSGSGTTSISVTVSNDSHSHTGSTVSGLGVSNFSGSAIQTGSESFSDSDTVLMTAAAVQDKILSYGYTTTTGDITNVSAGNGLTGGGSSGSVTLNVGAGTGISVAADTVGISSNGVGATQLNVSGNGTTSQFLRSDGDGSFTWATPTDTNTTYTGGGNYGITISGTEIRLEDDRRRNSSSTDIYSGNTHDYTFYDASVGIRWYTAGAEEMRLENDGDLHVDGDVVAYSTTVSDERLKENIVGIDGALGKLNQLNGYTFKYKADGRVSAGVIAQEVEKVLPEAVAEKGLPYKADDDQMYKVVSYDALHGLLIEAIKELSAEVEALKGAK